MKTSNSTNWLYNKTFDLVFILSPPFLAVLFVLLFAENIAATDGLPLWAWVVFVLCIDVSHVYSTLFRTYFNKKEFSENKTLYTVLPLGIFFIGVILHMIGAAVFWRVLAYSAVFHFIRQQYGFLRLYSRNDKESTLSRRIDALLLYTSTLYPIVYWHVNLPRNFRWFTDGDFFTGMPSILEEIFSVFYLGLILIYLAKEIRTFSLHREFNLAKNLIVFARLNSLCKEKVRISFAR